MADPAAPTVPDAKGVPPVNGDSKTPSVVAATGDGPTIVVTAQLLQWAIVDSSGATVFNDTEGPDSYREIEDAKTYNIPNYPVEKGGFQSYNKVERPGEVHLVVMKGGTISQKSALRRMLDTLQASLDLLNIITPARTYTGYNLLDVKVRRTPESGASLLTLELAFMQVRNTVTASFSATKAAPDASNISGGAVQPTNATGPQIPPDAPQ